MPRLMSESEREGGQRGKGVRYRSLFPAEGSDEFLGTDFFRIPQKKHVVTNTSEPPVGECKILRNSLSHGMFSIA